MYTTNVATWLNEANNYDNYYWYPEKEQYKNIKQVIEHTNKKINDILLPFIDPINNIIKNYLSITDYFDCGINIPSYKLFTNINLLCVYHSFLNTHNLVTHTMYNPAIVIVIDTSDKNNCETELKHTFKNYQILDIYAENQYVSMNVYCNKKLHMSLDSNFTGKIEIKMDPYETVMMKFWTRAHRVVLTLRCL
jgi:hypothetical protein